MESATVYLRTALFSPNNDNPHVPAGVAALGVQVVELGPGGLTVDVTSFLDARGRNLDGRPCRLFLPWSKVDHAMVHVP